MLHAIVVIVTVGVAILVGQTYPMLGGLIAVFPIKMFVYAAASSSENAAGAIWGLLVGSFGSVACAAAMWFTLRYGMPIALGSGLAAWSLVALIGHGP
jgi:hypothetical protein